MKEDLSPRLRTLGSPEMRRSILGRIGMLAVREAKILVPRKMGNLDRSIRLGAHDDKHVLILAGGIGQVGYAAAVEFGSRPHMIVPKRARVLAWGGQRRLSGALRAGAKPEFFAMRVNHPGTRAKPYLVPGARAAMRKAGLRDGVIKAWNDAS